MTKQPTTTKPWSWKKPLPSFATEAEELAFWHEHEIETPPDGVGELLLQGTELHGVADEGASTRYIYLAPSPGTGQVYIHGRWALRRGAERA